MQVLRNPGEETRLCEGIIRKAGSKGLGTNLIWQLAGSVWKRSKISTGLEPACRRDQFCDHARFFAIQFKSSVLRGVNKCGF